MPLRSAHKRILRALAILVVLASCFYFFRSVSWAKLGEAVASARWRWILLAAVINFFHLLLKAARWRVLLAPVGNVSLRSLFRYTLGGYAASNLLPARFGEVLRVFYLRPHGIPAAGAAGVQMLEKVYDVLGLLLLVAPLPFFLHLPAVVSNSIGLLSAIALVSVLVMAWMAVRHRLPKQGLLGRIAAGMAVLRDPKEALKALGYSLLAWLSDGVEVMLVLLALGITHDFFVSMLVLLFINFAIALPSTPGQLGAFEAGGVLALNLFGVGTEQALAFALIYHFMQAIPVTLAGMEALVLWRSLRQAPAGPAVQKT